MKHIKQIELVFENCEVMDVTNSVGDFDIEEITTEVHRVASNSISKISTANLINFQIYGNGEIKCHLWDKITPIERLLKYNDITSIDITYLDDTVESFYTKYNGEELNKYQTMKEYKGDIFVVISPDKTVDDIYTEELMEELINARDFCMNEDVQAINNLKDNHWIILHKDDEYIQLLNEDIASIIINKDNTNILFKNSNNKNYIIPNTIMYDICSLVFNLCYLKYDFKKDSIEDFEHLIINQVESFDYEDTLINFNFSFRLSNNIIHAVLKFIRDKDNLNNNVLPGELIIDKYSLPVEDVYQLLWILHSYLPDEFWR